MLKNRFFLIVLMAVIVVTSFQLYRINQASRIKSTASTNTQLNLNVLVGSLSQTVSSDIGGGNEVKLNSVDVTTAPPTGVDTTGDFNTTVRDHRGLAIGWSQTVTCTDFTSGADVIPVTNLSIVPTTLTPIGTSDPTGVHLGPSHNFANTSDAATIIFADAGRGQGRYDIYNLLNLHVDKNTPVGLYVSTMTVTIS